MLITNAQLVLPDSSAFGSIRANSQGLIDDIQVGGQVSDDSDAVDFDGDYLLPGFVELHTDNLERHILPRPNAHWPDSLAAATTHDAEIATAGITTVFDSIRVGTVQGETDLRGQLVSEMVASVVKGQQLRLFRVDHHLHLRCELTDPGLLSMLEREIVHAEVGLVSLMDHTPGQRQWRNIEALRKFQARSGRSQDEINKNIEDRIDRGQQHVADNRAAVLTLLENSGVVLASHDDTTLEHIHEAHASGIRIAEFPCSLDAAKGAAENNLYTLGGAPNVVRGGSHSGNVSVIELAEAGVLHGLSSDYVPASLVQAVFILTAHLQWPLHVAAKQIAEQPANMLGLHDRGQLAQGKRADWVRVQVVDGTPIVRATYVKGKRVA